MPTLAFSLSLTASAALFAVGCSDGNRAQSESAVVRADAPLQSNPRPDTTEPDGGEGCAHAPTERSDGGALADAEGGAEHADGGTLCHASAVLVEDGTPLKGIMIFDEIEGGGAIHIHVELSGVPKSGKHGIHLHEMGMCDPLGGHASAGGHWNPDATLHACPPTAPRHAGDLGNIDTDDTGTGTLDLDVPGLTVGPGDHSVLGRAVILHAQGDDCVTQPSGGSGDRIACGVISAQ